MATLYLHIGMPKTGSTAIQNAFADGKEHLAGRGVGYFDLGTNHSSLFKALFRGEKEKPKKIPKFFRKTLDAESRRAGVDREALVQAFDRALAANTMPKLVMSAEMLFWFRPKHVAAVKAHLSPYFDRIRIVAYVRDPVSWASSNVQQIMKHTKQTLEEVCDPKAIAAGESPIVPAYRAGLESYIQLFGREAVDIRLFDRGSFVGGDLISDFCAAVGEPSLAGGLTGRIRNPSLSYEAVLLVDQYKASLAAREDQNLLAKVATFHKRMEGLEGTRFVLPRETLEQVRTAVADDVGWLRGIMKADIFADSYSTEAANGPAWSASTLRQLAELIDQGSPARPLNRTSP